MHVNNNYRPQNNCTLNHLPSDILKIVISFLTPVERFPLRFVNKKISQLDLNSFSKDFYIPGIVSGSITYLKWIRGLKYPLDVFYCKIAASKGQIEILKWLKENGCSFNKEVSFAAIEGNHRETLKWLRENGCPWDEWSCAAAAFRDSVETLKWMIDNGCPWDRKYCMLISPKNGAVEKWILENES